MKGIKSKQNNKIKKIVIFFGLLILLFALINSVFGVYSKKKNAQVALLKMQEELKSLEEREMFLNSSLERLETEEGIDFEIRRKLNVALQDEEVAIIVNEEVEEEVLPQEKTFWQKVKSVFFD